MGTWWNAGTSDHEREKRSQGVRLETCHHITGSASSVFQDCSFHFPLPVMRMGVVWGQGLELGLCVNIFKMYFQTSPFYKRLAALTRFASAGATSLRTHTLPEGLAQVIVVGVTYLFISIPPLWKYILLPWGIVTCTMPKSKDQE